MINIENEIFTTLKNTILDASVVKESPEVILVNPTVVFSETNNITDRETVDSSGETHSEMDFKIEIYTMGDDKRSVSQTIRVLVDSIMGGQYGMTRTFSEEIPNFADRRIYRYVLKYNCLVNNNGKIYRR